MRKEGELVLRVCKRSGKVKKAETEIVKLLNGQVCPRQWKFHRLISGVLTDKGSGEQERMYLLYAVGLVRNSLRGASMQLAFGEKRPPYVGGVCPIQNAESSNPCRRRLSPLRPEGDSVPGVMAGSCITSK